MTRSEAQSNTESYRDDPIHQQQSVLVIGEALTDMVVRYGSADDQAEAVPGGSPANVALTLGRLRVPVELVTWTADDRYGRAICDHLEESGVLVGDASKAASATSKAIARLDQQGAATYTFMLEWAPVAPIRVPESVAVLHTGSIAAVLEPGASAVLAAISSAREHALITYDPNARPQIMGDADTARAAIEAVVSRADVVKASDEDLAWLYPDRAPQATAKAWMEEFGVPLVVMTRGSQGPIAWLGPGVERTVKPKEVEVVDTVGAGDTFMGGLIDALWRRGIRGGVGRYRIGLLSGDELQGILDEAAELADVVVQRRGANPPWAHELDR